jgi:hypothetical protein
MENVHFNEFLNFHYSLTTSRWIRSSRIKWAVHEARVEGTRKHKNVYSIKLKGRNTFGNLSIDGRIILRWAIKE